jgi:hypothetical protein
MATRNSSTGRKASTGRTTKAKRTRGKSTRQSASKASGKTARSSSKAEFAPMAPKITAAEKRKMAQEEARWRAEGDLRTLRQADEIRRDKARLQRAAGCAADEMRALQAIRSIKPSR